MLPTERNDIIGQRLLVKQISHAYSEDGVLRTPAVEAEGRLTVPTKDIHIGRSTIDGPGNQISGNGKTPVVIAVADGLGEDIPGIPIIDPDPGSFKYGQSVL